MGPSHHVRLAGCALSSLKEYATPLYSLPIDQQGKWYIYATHDIIKPGATRK